MQVFDIHKVRLQRTKMVAIRTALICISAAIAAITVPSSDSASLGQVFAQSTESDGRPPRELSAGWERFGQALLIYCGVLLAIAVLLGVAHRLHGDIFASEEEQRTRDEWYGTRNDDNNWW